MNINQYEDKANNREPWTVNLTTCVVTKYIDMNIFLGIGIKCVLDKRKFQISTHFDNRSCSSYSQFSCSPPQIFRSFGLFLYKARDFHGFILK